MAAAWFDHALVLCFVVLLPLGGATITYRRLASPGGDAGRRMRFYLRTLVLQVSMLVLVLAAWYAGDREWTQLGVAFLPRFWEGIAAFAFAAVFVWRFHDLGSKERRRIALRVVQEDRLGRLAPIMPRSRHELDLFVVLLLVAAVSEEVLFRGYLTAYLRSYLSFPVAACVAVLAFAAAHAYQGPKGVVLTGAVGGICMLLFVLSGSVWPGVLLHGGCNWVGAHLGHAAARTLPANES